MMDKKVLLEKYAQKILAVREREKLSQEDFAKKIGTSQTMIYRWEQKKSLISTEFIEAINFEFNLPMAYWDSSQEETAFVTKSELKKYLNDSISPILQRLGNIK